MTQIKVDTIADAAGTGAADFADGITIAGGALSALNTAEYYSSASEPTSPKDGAIWWDTTNEKVMVYIAGEFKEVELGASAVSDWTVDLSNVTYDSISYAPGQSSGWRGITVSPDGTKLYVSGSGANRVYQHSMSTAFDLSTASYDSKNFSIQNQDSFLQGNTFSPDGTIMYLMGNTNDTVFQYNLSTAFDVSTATYPNKSLSTSSQGSTLCDLNFNGDGTKAFALNGTSIYQYSLTTGFDVSTGTYDNVSFSVNSQATSPYGFKFNPSGTKMYVSNYGTGAVYSYTLSTAFDMSTASYDNSSVSVIRSGYNNNMGIDFSADGTKMYISHFADFVAQYSTGL